MPAIDAFTLYAAELPFKDPFKHSAAERASSSSLFLECRLDDGTRGWGECLPREYVTGESRDGALEMLERGVLSRLVGRAFETVGEVEDFLRRCDGKAPGEWVPADVPQTAAWSAVDLALLDAYGRAFGVPALAGERRALPARLRYSGALSSTGGWPLVKSALKQRLFGIRAVKLKVEREGGEATARTARRVLGAGVDLRADANMAWTVDEALAAMHAMARHGVRSFEQPLPAHDLSGAARLVAETGLGVMADESLWDRGSLERLIAERACTAVNVRISKCGGLVAALARSREALDAGLTVQVGCQVGESSLLSAAHLALVQSVQQVTYAEGCFGRFLLREDPARPLLQFGHGGRPPPSPEGSGLGVRVDASALAPWVVRTVEVTG
jgi:muconate cycloisomerase